MGSLSLAPLASRANESVTEAIISVKDQRMVVLREGGQIAKYPVSTSRFGTGDSGGSYKTPLGKLKVCDKLGDGLPSGAVIKHRQATGEVLAANAAGRDPIVTRILWLEGCESQNANARARSIYIHGTTEERALGKPVSFGCVRMRSSDVLALYDDLPVGALITIIPEKLPHYAKYVPKPEPGHEMLIAAAKKEVAPAPIATLESTRKASTSAIKADTMITTSPKLAQAMRGSILSSGLSDGNSEIPQLNR